MSEQLSPYQILGIPFGAAQKEIRKAYRTLAMKYHPDRNPADPDAEEKFKQVQWAYETLTGHTKSRGSVPSPASRWGFADPFSDSHHPFFDFYMFAKQHLFKDQDKESPPKKRRSRGNKR